MQLPTTATEPSTQPAQPDPHATVKALAAEHGLQIEEWDTTTLDANLRDKFFALYAEVKGDRFIVVPTGQDPAHRLAAVRALIAHQGVTA